MTTPTAAEPAEPRYTQGIMADGAAILDDGVLITVEEILDRLNASAMAPSAPDDIVALVQAALDDSFACGEHTTNDAESYATAFICAEASHAALLAAIGRMGGAAVPAHRDVFSGLHVERLVREWFSTPLAASVDPRLVDGLIDVLRMRLRRASPAPAHVPKSVALDDVVLLADAMWQLLDDMGVNGLSVCPAAKAAARLAYEPFADADVPLEYTAAAARAVALSSTATEPSSGALRDMPRDKDLCEIERVAQVLGFRLVPLASVNLSLDALREARYCLEQLRRIQGWEDPSDADEEQSNWSVYQRTIEALESFEQAAAMVPSAPADLVALVDAYGNAAYWSHQMEDDSGIGVARNALLAAIASQGSEAAEQGDRG